VALGGLWIAACASRPAVFEVSSELPTTRRVPGLATDLPSHRPHATRSGSATRATLALTQPADSSGAIRTMEAFFDALRTGQPEKVLVLLSPDGRHLGDRYGRQSSLHLVWSRRLAQLDYTALPRAGIYRRREIEIYRANDAPRLHARRSLKAFPASDEVLLRVRLLDRFDTRMNPLLSDEMLFVMRPRDGTYQITQIRDDLRLP
jgi:hypothetical protein